MIDCPECRGKGGGQHHVCGMCNGSGKVAPSEAFKAFIRHAVANGAPDETHPSWPDLVVERGGADNARAAVSEWFRDPKMLIATRPLKVPARLKLEKATPIDSGFYQISENYARHLAGELPAHGREKLVEHEGKKHWLARTLHNHKMVWSIREARET